MTALVAPWVGLHKSWYGGAFGPQRLAPFGAKKVAKSKRDVDGGRQDRRPAQLSGPDAEPKPWLLYRTEVCGTVQGRRRLVRQALQLFGGTILTCRRSRCRHGP